MSQFRDLLSWWNEGGLALSLLLCVGYFGSRSALAFLPAFFLCLFVAVGLALVVMLAMNQSQATNEYGEASPWFDRALTYGALFLSGTAAVTFLGSVL
jgi:uncharacterized membrane protein YhaH (DUF805 family)